MDEIRNLENRFFAEFYVSNETRERIQNAVKRIETTQKEPFYFNDYKAVEEQVLRAIMEAPEVQAAINEVCQDVEKTIAKNRIKVLNDYIGEKIQTIEEWERIIDKLNEIVNATD